MNILFVIKNPIIFGIIVGLISVILLILHDKFIIKNPEKKSSLITYIKLFFASAFPTFLLTYLFFNRNLSFHSNKLNGGDLQSSIVQVSDNGSTSSSQHIIEKITKPIKKNRNVFTDPYPE